MSNPTNTAQNGRGPFAVLRRAKNVKNAKEAERNALLEDAERIETWCAWLVLMAIVLEAVLWISPLCPFLFKLGNFVADATVGMGIYGEMRFGHVVGDILKILLAQAIEHAAKADLARIELEAKLAPRSLTKEQFEKLQTLKGRIKSVIVAHDVDWEPSWFAHVLAIALQRADISVGLVARGAHAHGSANFVCDRRAFVNPDGIATNGEPLVSALNEAGIPILGILAGRPGDLPDSDPDTPMIVIGNQMALAAMPPYVGTESPAPPITMLESMRSP
jgi:hypothetical protein